MAITSMENAFSVSGKNAIVTGGSKGIGYGIAKAYAQGGANVAIVARNVKAGEKTAAELSAAYPGKIKFYQADMADLVSCRAAVNAIIADYGSIDILVNNAGVLPAGDLLDMDENLTQYMECIEIDLNGVVRMTYLLGQHMRERGKGGKIINISSNAGLIANREINMVAYCAAKAGVNHFTGAVAIEFARYGINVNAISPGFTVPDDAPDFIPEELPEGMIDFSKVIPTKRLGKVIEIGALATFLASEASDQITGIVVPIDGGHSLGI